MKKRSPEAVNNHPASFRDNSGGVFIEDGVLLRGIHESYEADFDKLFESGLYQYLNDKKWLIRHDDVATKSDTYHRVVKPEFIPLISYPSEWSFSMLKDAALLTLNVQKKALEYGMVLKDASVYNVQFYKGKPVFIDLLSFESYRENSPWQAYGQFCRHFLAPLALMKYKDVTLNKLFVSHLDGVPLNLAVSLLPLRANFRIGLYMHLFLHSRVSTKYNSKPIKSGKLKSLSTQSLINLTESLIDTVTGLDWKPEGTEWGDYYDKSTSEQYITEKKAIIGSWLNSDEFPVILDIGANDGEFSRLASSKADLVYSFDIDPACVDNNYNALKSSKIKNIYPLLIDFANPTPSYGWGNTERDALLRRIRPNLILSLAVIHHLRITSGIPLSKQASLFSLLSKHLIIEFVPKRDEKVITLLQNREDIFDDYTEQRFEEIFQEYFEILDKKNVSPTERTLYFLKRIS
jgi:hypothetical protein